MPGSSGSGTHRSQRHIWGEICCPDPKQAGISTLQPNSAPQSLQQIEVEKPHRDRREKQQLSKKRSIQYDTWVISELSRTHPQLIFHFQPSLDKSPNNPGTGYSPSVSTKIAGTRTMLRELKSRMVPCQETRSFTEQERKLYMREKLAGENQLYRWADNKDKELCKQVQLEATLTPWSYFQESRAPHTTARPGHAGTALHAPRGTCRGGDTNPTAVSALLALVPSPDTHIQLMATICCR